MSYYYAEIFKHGQKKKKAASVDLSKVAFTSHTEVTVIDMRS